MNPLLHAHYIFLNLQVILAGSGMDLLCRPNELTTLFGLPGGETNERSMMGCRSLSSPFSRDCLDLCINA